MGRKLRRRCMHCIHYIGRRYGGYCGLTREHVSPYETCEKFIRNMREIHTEKDNRHKMVCIKLGFVVVPR